jgi:hypothetical protein
MTPSVVEQGSRLICICRKSPLSKDIKLPQLAIWAASGTQDVRIVGIDSNFSDWDAIKVEVKK